MDAAAIKAFFEDVASDWDTMRLAYYDERVIEQLAERTHLTGAETVVDVGTGTGFVAAGLAPRADRVLGFDNAAAMLDVARKNLQSLAITSVEIAEADVHALPLRDDAAAAATVANMVLHHTQDPDAMIAEMARVTRPGGWVAITDEVKHPYE